VILFDIPKTYDQENSELLLIKEGPMRLKLSTWLHNTDLQM